MVSEPIDLTRLKQIVGAALLAADEPLTVDQLVKLFHLSLFSLLMLVL